MAVAATKSTEIEVFFDGGCPLCLREVPFLKRRDRQGKILFMDIDAADFRPAKAVPRVQTGGTGNQTLGYAAT